MAKIIIDGTVIRQKGFGVSRYTLNLIKNLAIIDNKNQYTIFIDKEANLPNLPSEDSFIYREVKARPQLCWRLIKLPLLARNIRCDILHSPVELIPPVGVKNAILTVHEISKIRHKLRRVSSVYDLISHKINEWLFPLCLRRAKKLIAVSKNTKWDIMQMYNIEEEKIAVIWEAAEDIFKDRFNAEEKANFCRKIGAEEGYILNFATGDDRENNQIVLEAWKVIIQQMPLSKKLLFSGCPNEKIKELRQRAKKMGIENWVKFLGFVDEETLVKLYSAADIYVDISYYEGFGLQVVEAMACGTPVITSNVASLPEVVGEGGRLVGVDDKDGLVHELLDLLISERRREELSKKAIKSAARFSWMRTAEETLKVWNHVLKRL